MDIEELTKEELKQIQALQSQITKRLETIELEELKKQIPQEQLKTLVQQFNDETNSKNVPFTLSLKHTRNAGYVLTLIDTRDNFNYNRVREQRTSLDFLIQQAKRHIKCIPVYKAFVDLDIDEFEYTRFNEYGIKFKYQYANVDFSLDYSGKQCELTASLCIHHRTDTCQLSVKGLELIVKSENNGVINITLKDFDICNANELKETTNELKRKIYDTSESLEGEY